MNNEEKPIKLLIVDDNEKFLKTIAERLGLRDFDVTPVTEGNQAIEAAKKDKFDVALLDLKMPGMDGMELLKILKEKNTFLEVVILTGHSSIDSAVEATKQGAIGYLEKPYNFEKLLEILKEAYETRLRKKFEQDKKRMEKIKDLVARRSTSLDLLRSLRRLDDEEK
ncbi:response regulator [Thermodesulfobacteriota bacterium]